MLQFINNVLIILYILSCVNILRHLFFLVQLWYLREKVILNKTTLFLLGLSISYVIFGWFNPILLTI